MCILWYDIIFSLNVLGTNIKQGGKILYGVEKQSVDFFLKYIFGVITV